MLLLEQVKQTFSEEQYGHILVTYLFGSGTIETHQAVTLLLLEQGVDADSKDSQGRTPLSYAAERGHEDAVKLLPARDLDVESVDKFCTTIVCRIEWIY